MESQLPKISRKDMKRAISNPQKFVRRFISRLSPVTEFSDVEAYAYHIPKYGLVVVFELYHSDIWNGEFTYFRTGRVMMSFHPDGRPLSIDWVSSPYNGAGEPLGLRPLWLPHHFWGAIPLSTRLLDPDYALDPFGGAADFHPVRKNSNNEGVN